jgi:hypothetical protein
MKSQNPNQLRALEEKADKRKEAVILSRLQDKILNCYILKKHKIPKGFRYEKVRIKEGKEKELAKLYKEVKKIKRNVKKRK